MKKSSQTAIIIFSIFFILVILSPGRYALRAQEAKPSPALKGLLPEVPGWSLSGEPKTYFPGTLYEYIDGASEAYLSYDFKELLVAEYQKIGSETSLNLEIYDMGSPLNAFGIFSTERYPDIPEAGIGDAGYQEEEVLNFISGRYYIKLICYNGNSQTSTYLRLFARQIESRLKEKGGLPSIFSLFPAEGRVKNSEKYIKKNFMGFEFLKNGYAVTYKQGQSEYDGFIIEADSPAEAQSMLQKILAFYSGEKTPFVQEGNKYHQKNAYGQHIFLGQVKNYLFGFSRVPEGLISQALNNFELLSQALEKKK
ncbi:MAG: hypothetical protein JHC32_05550 [Candidatus Aminicenantes bacterium]|jgi:hypothetical protein|nr:hypothetical protein [Candidatus Aminicenantes bacterium]